MTTLNPLPDVLRWQLTRDFAVALDRDNEAIAEVAGKRVIVPHPVTAMEAFRQVSSARRGQHQPGDETIIARFDALQSLVRQIAEWRKEGEPTTEGEPFDAACDDAVDDRDAVIGEARELLGIVNPYPDPDPRGDDLDETPPRFRWATHNMPNGTWCRWSHVSVSDKMAGGDDPHCPFNCPDSTIELHPDEAGQ